MSELIISVSGLRGKIGKNLNADVIIPYISAYIHFLNEHHLFGPLVVGYDGRESGKSILQTILRTAEIHHREILISGVTATPTLGVLVKFHHAAGGIQITASHNPHPWNGLKLFGPDGRILSKNLGSEVKTLFENFIKNSDSPLSDAPSSCISENPKNILSPSESFSEKMCREIPDTITPHMEVLLKTVNVQRIQKRKFRVLLHSNHGSGSVLGIPLLEKLGCDVLFTSEKETPDGNFIHTPEPTEENLHSVCPLIPAMNTDVGFCQDPDADRLAIIDASGRYIGEEYTVALCAEHILSQFINSSHFTHSSKTDFCTDLPAVITNCSTSLMTRDVARKYGFPFHFSAVGEANVVEKMLETGAIFAGEGNGGPIDPRVGYVRDSFVGMVQILDMMAARNLSVAQLADALPRYEIVKTKFHATAEQMSEIFEQFIKKYPDAQISRLDGLRLSWEDSWILVRGSNTEPIIRIIAEAKTREDALKKSALPHFPHENFSS
ncbi:MAG: phosphoglucosamine mutase [Planctomycetia bacterium]|nr:phosphoglucosamine mutase [Planctomycetia bacterium]